MEGGPFHVKEAIHDDTVRVKSHTELFHLTLQ